MKSKKPRFNPDERYLVGQKAIAGYLGCSRSTFKRWAHDLDLPVVKIGNGRTGKVAASPKALDRWLRKRGRHRPGLEIMPVLPPVPAPSAPLSVAAPPPGAVT